MTKMTKRLAIIGCEYREGGLYEVMGEDSFLYVFDTICVAQDAAGKRWKHKTFVVKGCGRDEEGHMRPNRNWKAEAEAFVEKVLARGTLDLAHWEAFDYVYDAVDAEAYNLRVEADERAWGVS